MVDVKCCPRPISRSTWSIKSCNLRARRRFAKVRHLPSPAHRKNFCRLPSRDVAISNKIEIPSIYNCCDVCITETGFEFIHSTTIYKRPIKSELHAARKRGDDIIKIRLLSAGIVVIDVIPMTNSKVSVVSTCLYGFWNRSRPNCVCKVFANDPRFNRIQNQEVLPPKKYLWTLHPPGST